MGCDIQANTQARLRFVVDVEEDLRKRAEFELPRQPVVRKSMGSMGSGRRVGEYSVSVRREIVGGEAFETDPGAAEDVP